jgi:hypothetical protein
MDQDSGAGELLVVVLGGVFETRAQAQTAAAGMSFGDVEGYYVVPVAQFQGFKEQVPATGDHALVSAFRTEEGAQEFVAFATALGYPAEVLEHRVRSLGGLYAGLGQEPAPDGSGPHGTDPRVAAVSVDTRSWGGAPRGPGGELHAGGLVARRGLRRTRSGRVRRASRPRGLPADREPPRSVSGPRGDPAGFVSDDGRELHYFAGFPAS